MKEENEIGDRSKKGEKNLQEKGRKTQRKSMKNKKEEEEEERGG